MYQIAPLDPDQVCFHFAIPTSFAIMLKITTDSPIPHYYVPSTNTIYILSASSAPSCSRPPCFPASQPSCFYFYLSLCPRMSQYYFFLPDSASQVTRKTNRESTRARSISTENEAIQRGNRKRYKEVLKHNSHVFCLIC